MAQLVIPVQVKKAMAQPIAMVLMAIPNMPNPRLPGIVITPCWSRGGA